MSFQDIKHRQGEFPVSAEEEKLLLKLKGQIQAARNIDDARFPEIKRITSQINLPTQKVPKKQCSPKSKKLEFHP